MLSEAAAEACYTIICFSDSCASGLPHQIRVSRLSCVSSLSIPLEPAIRFDASFEMQE